MRGRSRSNILTLDEARRLLIGSSNENESRCFSLREFVAGGDDGARKSERASGRTRDRDNRARAMVVGVDRRYGQGCLDARLYLGDRPIKGNSVQDQWQSISSRPFRPSDHPTIRVSNLA